MSMETGLRDWANISDSNLDSRYEKCRNITEEIYKRIDITFQIKKLEAGHSELSDNSELIDSNELSNETDLFACDKSDIPSSSEAERPTTDCGKFININNNEEKNKPQPVYKRPKKRFRKRVKKRAARARSYSEGSSDEAPLSRMADTEPEASKPKSEKRLSKTPAKKSPQKKLPTYTIDKKNTELGNKTLTVCIDKLPIQNTGTEEFPVKNYRSFMKDNKLTIKTEPSSIKMSKSDLNAKDGVPKDIALKTQLSLKNEGLSMKSDKLSMKEEKERGAQWKSCSLCSLSFRGERGLRRHMSMSHVLPDCK